MTYDVHPTELTDHARERGAQRRLSPAAVDYVLAYGESFRHGGADCYFLRRTDIPEDHRRYDQVARLERTLVVVNPENQIVTVYRAHRASHRRRLCRGSRD